MVESTAGPHLVGHPNADHVGIAHLITEGKAEVEQARIVVAALGRLEIKPVLQPAEEGFGLLVVRLEIRHLRITATRPHRSPLVFSPPPARPRGWECGFEGRGPPPSPPPIPGPGPASPPAPSSANHS